MTSPSIALALVDALDDDALDLLAAQLAPRLLERLPAATADSSWIGSKQAAAYLGITTSSLWKFTAAREIPFEQDRPGGKLWFKRNALDAWREGAWTVICCRLLPYCFHRGVLAPGSRPADRKRKAKRTSKHASFL